MATYGGSDLSGPISGFVTAVHSAGLGSEQDARSQVFAPTCCPESITVAPGVVMRKPDAMQYAPNIDIAESKVAELRGTAKRGGIAVTNITMEPGMGKTIHLPFRFVDSKVLVVLPTLFDAWSAKLAAAKPSNISTFGYVGDKGANVTYTDSYYAAFLLTTGAMAAFDVVFIDESHSPDGVTTFLASVAVPGVSFVRMTATPKSVHTQARRSFPIMDERAAPVLSDVKAVGEFVSQRHEARKLVMAPSSESAELVAAEIPNSVVLTKKSPVDDVFRTLADQVDPVTIVTDALCSKGINLNLDMVLDFGLVETPTGVRHITAPEQAQRRARVGRSRPGVYCCSFVATAMSYEDHYSLFRANLWCVLNDIPTFPCNFPVVTKSRALKLLKMITEPALVPPESPILSSSSSSAANDSTTLPAVHLNLEPLSLQVEVEDGSEPRQLVESSVPPWLLYYMEAENHAGVYVGDMVYDHRSMASSCSISPELCIKPARNLVEVAKLRDGHGDRRVYSTLVGQPVGHRRGSGSTRSSETFADTVQRKRGSFMGLEHYSGAPLKMKRGSRVVRDKRGTAYKALSVCGSYLVECGLILAESSRVHQGLEPLDARVKHAFASSSADKALGPALYALQWVVARDVSELDVDFEVAAFSAVDAWTVPPISVVPTLDLQTDYHPLWLTVLSDRVRKRLVLPMVVPAVGWSRRKLRNVSTDLLADALDICAEPTYTLQEQQVVHKAWNILAAKTSAVAAKPHGVYDDAQVVLAYMATVDRLHKSS